jgi:DNA adenine methylase
MQYLGSKSKISKDILPIILKNRLPNQYYIEPFCGGCNLIDKVDGLRIANDSHYYLIALWKALQNGYIPPKEVSIDFWYEVKKNKQNYPDELVGFIGFMCSFGSKFFSSYAKNNSNTNYADRGYRMLLKQIKKLKDVKFYNLQYYDLEIPPKSIIYCDPPYKDTTKYTTSELDYDRFYNWCVLKKQEGHTIFVSEYNMPDNFKCVWSKDINIIIDKCQLKTRTEKLYTL